MTVRDKPVTASRCFLASDAAPGPSVRPGHALAFAFAHARPSFLSARNPIMRCPSRAFAPLQAGVLLTALLAAGCTQGGTRPSQEPHMSHTAAGLPETRLTLPGGEAIAVRIGEWVFFPEQNAIQVGYRLRNTGQGSIAVFDRGTYEGHAGAAYAPGPVADPDVVFDGDDLELRHVLAHSPATPLALQLEAGASVDGFFVLPTLGPTSPRRVRWCVDVLAFDQAAFRSPHASTFGTIWVLEASARADAMTRRTPVCTPWYSVATATFAR